MILGPVGKVVLDENAKGLMLELADKLKQALAHDEGAEALTRTHIMAQHVEFILREVAK